MQRSARTRYTVYWLAHVLLIAIGVILVRSHSTVLQAIGTSIVAAGICGCVVFFYVVDSEKRTLALEVLQDYGLERAFQSRGVRIRDAYDVELLKVRERIDILGFGLRSFLEDYHREFARWIASATVRILLIDPESPLPEHSYANQRDIEEQNEKNRIADDVRNFVHRSVNELPFQPRFQIRLYKCLPTINLFRIDGTVFWGPYLVGDQSRNMPTFLIREGGILFPRFVRHFEDIWTNDRFSRPIPTEWLDK